MSSVVVLHHVACENLREFPIAVVDCGDRTGSKALEYAYEVTQNIDESWSIDGVEKYFDIKLLYPNEIINGVEIGHRSTSIGDRMILDNQKFEVAAQGFERIE